MKKVRAKANATFCLASQEGLSDVDSAALRKVKMTCGECALPDCVLVRAS